MLPSKRCPNTAPFEIILKYGFCLRRMFPVVTGKLFQQIIIKDICRTILIVLFHFFGF